MVSSGSGSLTAEVYEYLRGEIVAGRFEPGQRLRPAHLASEQGVGLNAVREALSRLAGEGLVQAAPHYGFRVVAFSVEDITDVTRVRALVEGEAMRQSIARGDLDWETQLVGAHYRLANTPVTVSSAELNPDWVQAHHAFHAATMSACGSPRLIGITSALAESTAITIYRHWAELYLDSQHRADAAAAEHLAIFEATLARDGDLAARLNNAHNQGATDSIVTVLTKSATPAAEN